MKAMIFAAGLGTRLRPVTDTIPKALLPIAGKTLLQYQVEKLAAAGIKDIVINVHHFADQIVDYLCVNHNFGCNIAISDERAQLLDTGGGLRRAAAFFQDDYCLACNVDIVSNIDIRQLITTHDKNTLATLVVSERTTQRYLLFDRNGRMRGWTNIATGEVKPISLNADHYLKLAFSGMQILSPHIFSKMEAVAKEKGDKFSVIDLYLSLCPTEQIKAYTPPDYRMMDVGKIEQLSEAERFIRALSSEEPKG